MTTAPPHALAVAVTVTAPGPLFVAASDVPRRAHRTLHVTHDAVLLHGWHGASTTLQLLTLVSSPATVLPYTAALHAARALEPGAPGSAALCGLARTLHLPPSLRRTLVARAVDAAADRVRAGGLAPVADHALRALCTLADGAPDDPAALAPLFLRLHRLPAGAEARLLDDVPAAVVSGTVEIGLDTADLVVAGLRDREGRWPEPDVARFTESLRPVPRAAAAAAAAAVPHRATA